LESILSGDANTTPNNTIYEHSLLSVAKTWREDLAARRVGFIQSHISPRVPKIQIFASMVKVSMPANIQQGGGVRGSITGFSPASRKRMIEYLAKMRNFKKPLFVTLTYPSVWNSDPQRWKSDLDAFFKRLNRIAPQCYGLWRIEPQKRGAPHYHILLTNHVGTVSRFIKWVALAWYQIVASGDEKHLKAGTRVEKLFNRQHAMKYVSKYVAKTADGERQFTTPDGTVVQAVGKHWGVFNRAAADVAQSAEYSLSPLELVELRRLMSRWLKSRGSRYAKKLKHQHPKVGFVVFGVGDSEETTHRLTIYKMLLSVFDEEFTWTPVDA